MIEIRWHGRGGQGAITAAKIFATAAFRSGYTGVVMAPTFGTERRGAPVFTSLKLAKEKIYDISPIETPDIVVVLDHLLLTEADVTGGLKPGGLIVLNTPKPFGSYDFDGHRLAVADVTALSVDAGLPHGRGELRHHRVALQGLRCGAVRDGARGDRGGVPDQEAAGQLPGGQAGLRQHRRWTTRAVDRAVGGSN